MQLSAFKVCDRDLNDDLLSHYLTTEAVAIDTETMGLVPGRDRLCLVQISDHQGVVTAIRIEKGQKEAPNLKKLMEAENIVKVFHFARFDVAQLLITFGIETQPIFCTKIASKIARTYTSNHGLKHLVQELIGVELDKSAQSSDWGDISNLSETQLSYAANDVLYLLTLREKLISMLAREDRLELAQKSMPCVRIFVDLDLNQYKDIFEH